MSDVFLTRRGGGKQKAKIVTWTGGSDEEVAAMIKAAHNGELNLADYWAVGDTRTVNLSAGVNSAGTAIPAQSVELVIAHKPTSTTYYGGGEFIIHQKNSLTITNYMNNSRTSNGSFAGSAMAFFLNDYGTGYLGMLPDWLEKCLLRATVITAQTYSGSVLQRSIHKVFLPAGKEVFGGTATSAGTATGYSNIYEYKALEQWEWFKTTANRIKKVSNAYPYWLRSLSYGGSGLFCDVASNGNADNSYAPNNYGVAPAMLI